MLMPHSSYNEGVINHQECIGDHNRQVIVCPNFCSENLEINQDENNNLNHIEGSQMIVLNEIDNVNKLCNHNNITVKDNTTHIDISKSINKIE